MSDSQKLDVVALIEKNQIVGLSSDYNSKLIHKIKAQFTDDQQKLFVASFFSYLNYNAKTDFVVDLDDIWKWLGFSRKDPAKRVLEKHFSHDVDYKIKRKAAPQFGGAGIENQGGSGLNKEQILMNIETFKTLCMLCGTHKSKEIRKYYLKLEEIVQDIVGEEATGLKLKLEQQSNRIEQQSNRIEQMKTHVKNVDQTQKHNLLLQEFSKVCNIVYIVLVKQFTDRTYVIKIGESRSGLLHRYNEHKTNYPDCIILECFSVKRSKDFESFLHSQLKQHRYTQLPGHERERELFLVGKELSLGYIKNLIDKHVADYNDDNLQVNILRLENEKLKLELARKDTRALNTSNSPNLDVIVSEVRELRQELKDVREYLTGLNLNSRTTTNFGEPLVTLGPRIQQLNPENLCLIRVFESVSDVLREFGCPRSSLMKACNNATVYLNFRWNLVDRGADCNDVSNVTPTKVTKAQALGYIAKLNKEKTEILAVYLDRKTASLKNGYESPAHLDFYVKHTKEADGHYYVLFDDCDEQVRREFIIKNGEPVLYRNGVGQYDLNGNLTKEFRSKHDCQIQLGLGNKTVCKGLETGKAYNDFYLKYLDDKIEILAKSR